LAQERRSPHEPYLSNPRNLMLTARHDDVVSRRQPSTCQPSSTQVLMRLIGLAVVAALSLPFAPLAAGAQQPRSADSRPFKPEELEQIVTPIVQYPDPLLAQMFMASTLPARGDPGSPRADGQPARVDAEARRCLPRAAKGHDGRHPACAAESAATARVILVLLSRC
jgi:hypothetical protein